MSWSVHTSSLRKYLLRTTNMLYHLRLFCSRGLLETVYYGLVQSKLQYGLTCWGGTFKNNIQPLLVVQKHILRIIWKKRRYEHSFSLFVNSNILPLKHLYFYKVLKVFFLRSGYSLNRDQIGYDLRSSTRNLVVIPPHNTHHFLSFYTSVAPRLFNKLPIELRRIRKPFSFNKKIKKMAIQF